MNELSFVCGQFVSRCSNPEELLPCRFYCRQCNLLAGTRKGRQFSGQWMAYKCTRPQQRVKIVVTRLECMSSCSLRRM